MKLTHVAAALLTLTPTAIAGPPLKIVPAAEAAWTYLNPARGDKAPMAATLFGDRDGPTPTGFLLKPKDGFESPPHIHNVSYRAVVLRGRLHNDHPDAPTRWMEPGSFWTQPRGGLHITSATGAEVLAYVEIDEGPYLVRPPEQAFDGAEQPLNVHASNLVWVAPGGGPAGAAAELAYLWGDPQADAPSGVFVRVPAGGATAVRSRGPVRRAVVVQGRPELWAAGQVSPRGAEPGAYIESRGEGPLRIACPGPDPCAVYLRANGGYELASLGSGR